MADYDCKPQTTKVIRESVNTFKNTLSLGALKQALSVVVAMPTHRMDDRDDRIAFLKVMVALENAVKEKEAEVVE